MSSKRILGLVSFLLILSASAAFAGGPLALYDPATRQAYIYPADTVDVFTDLGPMGMLTNGRADTLTAEGFAEWTNVASSHLVATLAGEILVGGVPTDVGIANYDSIIGPYNGGGIHVIYDHDGSIASALGAPPGVAGISTPEYADSVFILESWTVLVGSAIDPGDVSPPGAEFAGVFTHEFGHAINLAHTQANGGMIFLGDNLGPSGCPALPGTPAFSDLETMYPFIDPSPGGTGTHQATVDLLDDIQILSDLYPAGGWPSNTGTITGTIFLADSVSQVTGVNVIARNLADPLGDCVSALSGDYTQGAVGPDGLYTLNGLTPGADYVVYIDGIDPGITTSFATPPTSVVFVEEYWNGAGESGDLAADTACVYVPITAAAGVATVADIFFNSDPDALPLGDDDAIQLTLPFDFPFCGTAYRSVWIGSNGFLTFGFGDTNPIPAVNSLLIGAPRLAGLWTDLDPAGGGVIKAEEVSGTYEITYINVPEFYVGGSNSFTITLRPDGTHNLTYGSCTALGFFTGGILAGRSPGGGASDPGEIDLTAAAQPLGIPPGNETVYEIYTDLDLDLSSANLEFAPCGIPVAVPDPDYTPRAAALLQSRPNPFRSSTRIAFDLTQPGPVRLRVFDIHGRLVKTLVDETLTAGRYSVPWRGDDDRGASAAPGIYLYRLETPTFRASHKTIRIR